MLGIANPNNFLWHVFTESDMLLATLKERLSGIIWKIEVDNKYSIIAIETRNAETRTSHYSAFDFSNGSVLFKEVTVEDSWHWCLDRVSNGIIYLHSFVSEETPEHKGIIALNDAGKVVWQQFNKTLAEISDGGIIAYNPNIQPKKFELLDFFEGSVLNSSVPDFHPVDREIIIPEVLFDYSLLISLLPDNIAGEVVYTRFNNKDILSYHTRQNNNFTQQLLIVQNNEVLLQDNLAEGILKRNPEAFFIFGSHLFCIRGEKREIVSYLV